MNALILVLPLLVGTAPAEAPPKNPELKRQLLAMARDDQADPSPPGSRERNGAMIREIVAQYGWPGRTLVGADGAHAAWLVVQHQDADVAFQRRCLELMQLAFENGEATAQELSFLTDRVLTNEGKPQMYGTQSIGVRSPEDEARVDANRFALGLEPWRDFIKKRQEPHRGWKPSSD